MTPSRRHFLQVGGAAITGMSLSPRGSDALSNSDKEWLPQNELGATSWEEIRSRYYSLSSEYIYVNNSTLGPTLKPVQKRMEAVQRIFSEGCNLDRFVSEIILSIRPIREAMSRIVNSPPPAGKYIGNVDSVTEGMSLVANGLTFTAGDVILITDHEHTGGRTMWELQRDRYQARLVAIPLIGPDDTEATWKDNLLSRFRDILAFGDVKVLSFPLITTSTGHVLPTKELCALAREYGAISVVDAAQAFAVLPIDLVDMDCDFLIANGHKYLCGPVGSGFICVNPRRLESLASFWPTVVDETYYNLAVLTLHYPYRKAGVVAYTNFLPLQEALAFHESVGPAAIHSRLSLIGTWLRMGLAAFPDRFELITPGITSLSCVMTCFRPRGFSMSSEEVVNRLKDEFAVHVKWATEGGADAVRLSPHYYTTVSELARVAKSLCAIAGIASRSWFAAAPRDILL